jgi:hypothetical protein
MTTTTTTTTTTRRVSALASILMAAGLLAAAGPAQAFNGFLKNWLALYPGSTTGQASCSTCHGSSTSTLNPYGRDLCASLQGNVPKDVTNFLKALENLDSDLDPGAVKNLAEIMANAQPGWRAGGTPLFFTWSGGCAPTGAVVATPASVPLPYDPPVGGVPVAVPGGPYTGLVNALITFDGTGSYDSDGGSIVNYAWSFGNGFSITTTERTVQYAYPQAGTYTVTLTVTDNAGKQSSNTTTATVSSGTALDLDITGLSISGTARVGKAIAISLAVDNKGTTPGQALATIVGTMGGVEVYRWQLNVFDNSTRGSTTFTFPSYTPTARGTINWTATVADGDPDVDTATAVTTVK